MLSGWVSDNNSLTPIKTWFLSFKDLPLLYLRIHYSKLSHCEWGWENSTWTLLYSVSTVLSIITQQQLIAWTVTVLKSLSICPRMCVHVHIHLCYVSIGMCCIAYVWRSEDKPWCQTFTFVLFETGCFALPYTLGLEIFRLPSLPSVSLQEWPATPSFTRVLLIPT